MPKHRRNYSRRQPLTDAAAITDATYDPPDLSGCLSCKHLLACDEMWDSMPVCWEPKESESR